MIEPNSLVNDPLSDIGRQMASLSPAQRALLELRLLKKHQQAPKSRELITPRRLKSAPLSFHQQGLWVLNQLMPGESVYHTPTAARLRGPLDVQALTKSLQAIVDRHDALRTIFRVVDGEPVQFVQDVVLDVPLIDLSDSSEENREAE